VTSYQDVLGGGQLAKNKALDGFVGRGRKGPDEPERNKWRWKEWRVLRALRLRATNFDVEIIFEDSRILLGFDCSKDPAPE
jgi:hypothetical protein